MGTKRRIIRLILGWLFIVLGLLGLVLPILQGILFLVLGVFFLAPEIPFFARLLQKLRDHYPRTARKADKIKKRLHSRTQAAPHGEVTSREKDS